MTLDATAIVAAQLKRKPVRRTYSLMSQETRRLGILVPLLVLGCAQASVERPNPCPPVPPLTTNFSPPSINLSADLSELVGTYSLTIAQTLGGDAALQGRLTLLPTETPASRRDWEDMVLWGYVESSDSLPVTALGRDVSIRDPKKPGFAAVYNAKQHLSFWAGSDPRRPHTGMILYATEVSASGVWGRWFDWATPMLVDPESGENLGWPQGYFCAVAADRLTSASS